MGIALGSNFTVNTNLPLDDRIIVANTTERNAIVAGRRYEGLLVYSVADLTNFQLVGGITNGDWAELSSGGGGTTVVVERFSGNATTTVFNLANDPIAEENTQIYINGVYQQKNTYSTAGVAITFTTAPPVGTDNIEVTYFTAFSVASIPDNSITQAKMADNSVGTAEIINANVTTAKLADGAVTNAKKGAPNFVESGIAPNFGTTSITYVNVTNMSLSFTTTARMLEFGLNPTNSGSHRIQMLPSSSTSQLMGWFQFYNDTTTTSICEIIAETSSPSSSTFYSLFVPVGAIRAFAQPAAGTYTFRLRIKVNATSQNLVMDQVKLYVREL